MRFSNSRFNFLEVNPGVSQAPVVVRLPDGRVVQGVPFLGGTGASPKGIADTGKGMTMGKGMGKGKLAADFQVKIPALSL